LSYQDLASGDFVQIACGKRAEEMAPQIRAERAVQAAVTPVAETTPR